METTVKIKYIKQSATKVRFVLKLVKGMQVDRALNKLDVANKKAAITISKAIKSGISNLMNNNENFNQKNLFISNAAVDQGPTMKRFRPAAMGRATPILKRSSHLTLTLSEKK
tara:strand:+ start:357 stop:695 length:339 start_codon:yes stop_codon:yes gene_type:complete